MAYTICKNFTFAAAHRIPEHPGKCRHLHGHNYRVRVFLTAEKLDRLGMVIDFARLKSIANEVLDPLDHQYLNEIPPFDKQNPTAELISEHIFYRVGALLEEDIDARGRVAILRVEVWENDTSCAIFER